MATLKGQNFRILTYDATTRKYSVIGMATSCTVTLNNNTENASHKDIVGMATNPTVTSKNWQIQVESLNVADVGAMLTAIKSLTPFFLIFDETSTTDNQTVTSTGNTITSMGGKAFLTDATFQFDDRTNATKSLQFQGVEELTEWQMQQEDELLPYTAGDFTKGQYVRLFLGNDNTSTPSKCIAAARQLSLHVSLSLENATTKDTTGMWDVQEPTELSYDISTTALMRSGETITSSIDAQAISDIETIWKNGTPVKFQIANVSGANNRTKGSVIVSGSVICTSLTLNGPNRQVADYNCSLQGVGNYTVGA